MNTSSDEKQTESMKNDKQKSTVERKQLEASKKFRKGEPQESESLPLAQKSYRICYGRIK